MSAITFRSAPASRATSVIRSPAAPRLRRHRPRLVPTTTHATRRHAARTPSAAVLGFAHACPNIMVIRTRCVDPNASSTRTVRPTRPAPDASVAIRVPAPVLRTPSVRCTTMCRCAAARRAWKVRRLSSVVRNNSHRQRRPIRADRHRAARTPSVVRPTDRLCARAYPATSERHRPAVRSVCKAANACPVWRVRTRSVAIRASERAVFRPSVASSITIRSVRVCLSMTATRSQFASRSCRVRSTPPSNRVTRRRAAPTPNVGQSATHRRALAWPSSSASRRTAVPNAHRIRSVPRIWRASRASAWIRVRAHAAPMPNVG